MAFVRHLVNRPREMSRAAASLRKTSKSRPLNLESLEPRRVLAISAIPNQPLPVAPLPIALESGLIDNDPAIDLVTLSSSGQLSIALNATNANWRSVTNLDSRIGAAFGLAGGVLDSNSSLDIVAIGDNAARVFYGDGTGGFTPGAGLSAPAGGRWRPTDGGRAGATLGLVNRDVLGDIVLLDTAGNQAVVWFGQSDRSFSSPVIYATGGIDPTAVVVADVIGDYQPDIVVGHRDGSISFLEGIADGTFELKPGSTIRGTTPVRALSAGDLDADGDIDIAVAAQSQAYVLLRDASPLANPPIANGDFTNGLSGWQVSSVGQATDEPAGSISALGGAAQLRENSSFLTSLSQTFTIPPNPQTISIDVMSLGLEPGTNGAIPDAFELSLLARNNSSLVPTHRPGATSYFNASASNLSGGIVTTRLAAGVKWDGQRVTLDISQLQSGTEATLVMDLVGNPPGELSTVIVDNVTIAPTAVFSRSFTRLPLSSPDTITLVDVLDVAIGEVNGDDRQDVLLADKGGRLVVFNGTDQPGIFASSFIPASTLGGNPTAISLDRFQAASFATDAPLDAALVLDSNARVVTTLGADTTPPQAIFLSPAPGARLSSLSEVRVRFSEPVAQRGTAGENSVTNLNAWSLYEFGANGVDDRGLADDRRLPLTGVLYDSVTQTATVGIAAAARPLAEGRYGIIVRGQDLRFAIQDLFGNNLGGGSDATSNFIIDRRPSLGAIDTNPTDPVETQAVTLRVPLSDGVLGGPYAIAINWGDGTAVTNQQLSSPGLITANHVYAQRGSYTVRVVVTDAFDQRISVSRVLTVKEDKGLCLPTINFEKNASGIPITAPVVLTNQFAAYGIQVTASDKHGHDDDDDDDVSPTIVNWSRHVDRSTPGGAAAGNVLVIAEEDDDDYRPHHNSDDVDIESGTLTFRFQTPVMLDDVKLLGIKKWHYAKLQAYSVTGERISSKLLWGNWTGTEQTATLNATKVAKLTVQFSGRGAVSELVFCRDPNAAALLPAGLDEKSDNQVGPSLPDGQAGLGGNIAIGQVVNSTLAAGQTEDWTFTASAGQKIYVNFQSLSDEMQSELLDPTGTLLATAFSARASAHDSGTLTLENSGTYTLRLNAAAELAYQFQIFNVPAPDVNAITLDQLQSGALNSPGRPDHWTFQVRLARDTT